MKIDSIRLKQFFFNCGTKYNDSASFVDRYGVQDI